MPGQVWPDRSQVCSIPLLDSLKLQYQPILPGLGTLQIYGTHQAAYFSSCW
jgi:hypothetical protein